MSAILTWFISTPTWSNWSAIALAMAWKVHVLDIPWSKGYAGPPGAWKKEITFYNFDSILISSLNCALSRSC